MHDDSVEAALVKLLASDAAPLVHAAHVLDKYLYRVGLLRHTQATKKGKVAKVSAVNGETQARIIPGEPTAHSSKSVRGVQL